MFGNGDNILFWKDNRWILSLNWQRGLNIVERDISAELILINAVTGTNAYSRGEFVSLAP